LIRQARSLRDTLNDNDQEDVDQLLTKIKDAQTLDNSVELMQLEAELDDLLFYLAE
jgi:uncharacterized membrane protein YvbJ